MPLIVLSCTVTFEAQSWGVYWSITRMPWAHGSRITLRSMCTSRPLRWMPWLPLRRMVFPVTQMSWYVKPWPLW